MLKKFLFVFILIIFILPLCGCYDARGLENLVYVVALGIDKGENNNLRLTLQFALLNQNSGGDSSSSSSQSSSSTTASVECSTIDSGISLINSYISKQINLSHCKAIIISEELAYEGISEYLFPLVNNLEIRPDCHVIVCRCDAYDFLENSKPTLESVSARYYELISNSSEYTGFTQDLYLSDFYSDMLSTTNEPIAILGGINTSGTQGSDNSSLAYDGAYKANQTHIKLKNHIENMGLAVFKGDKLVGELDNIETLCHLIVTNKLKNATITIPNPYNYEDNISIYIGKYKDTQNSVKLINGTPYIECNLYISRQSTWFRYFFRFNK